MMDRDALLQLMGKIWNAYGLRLEQAFREANLPLNSEQFRFLKTVQERPGQYQEIYARMTGRDRSSTTRMIQSLLRKGWIERSLEKDQPELDQKDTRVKRIHLTPLGSDWLAKASQPAMNVLFPAWDNFPGEEREMLEQLLQRIYINIQ
ncbi:MAG: MarR family winged helix-turn-helix transcriptional regulator [Bacteroidota bacterium]